ncbi:hypothetical protein [Actinomadura madurae]|uniref:hypothetical protein n=1 Tax=Actinomadura madurae TaxID=1993 RepID=UPI0020D208CB|nr:hypothetical protein [Actinomadura madurae]MCQ0018239.1 hypothetical protein [Actinomadura madurae]
MAGALVAVSAAPHAITPQKIAVAHADPEPSTKELRAKALKLADQLEQLTEQYNGLRVKLSQSQRAAKVATENAERQEKSLEELRQKVGALAATSYMQGGSDPTVSFVASQDPQAVLDQAATLHYFAKQDSTQVLGLMQAMQSAQRARKSAGRAPSRSRSCGRSWSRSARRSPRPTRRSAASSSTRTPPSSPSSPSSAPARPRRRSGTRWARSAAPMCGAPRARARSTAPG